ncbi:MAG: hypothetical protein RIM99_04035 [Cyclobacteriaceae bacterium]
MQKNLLQIEQSEWWVLLLIVIAFGLTWFLYSVRKKAWSKNQNLLLGGLRFVAIFLTLGLLLDPYINQSITRTEKPVIAVGIDNSQSVVARTNDSIGFKANLERLRADFTNAGLEVRTFYLNEDDSLNFNHPVTDLSVLQQRIDSDMEGRNHVASILFTDGIFNKGNSPVYRQYAAPQFTIGLGDTIPPKDINLSRILYNRVTFKGNETPIRVEVSQKGFDNQEIVINLSENGRRLDRKRIRLDGSVQEVEFLVKSEEEGLRKMEVSTSILENEFVRENNSSKIFMEVIDGRQKVLIVAETPHPDIKAIRSALSATDNYQTDVYIPSISDKKPEEIYDVVIYHGAFSGRINFNPKEDPGVWYILNEKSALNDFRKNVSFFNIRKRGSQPDKVTAGFNQSFSRFRIPENQGLFEDFPPVTVPFGDYELSGPAEVLLFQRVGSIVTKKPLFAFYDDGSQKSAVLAGQNIWKWKLQESAITGESRMFQEIITKTVQFLSLKNDKQQFRFRSRGNNFSSIEAALFDSEVYNDIYERIYGNKISLKITNDEGESLNYEFTDSEFNSSFSVPMNKSGVYSYEATVKVGDKTLRDKGQFLVEEINREYQNLTANHNLLRVLSAKTEGEYLHYSNLNQLAPALKNRGFKNLIRSSESYFPLLQSSWMLLIILLLFSSEWLLRKYWGGY